MNGWRATCLTVLLLTCFAGGGASQESQPPQSANKPSSKPVAPTAHDLDWELANARWMFVSVNDGSGIAAITVDTITAEDMQAALKPQELVFRLGGARMPIVDRRFVTVPWGKIHIQWDTFPPPSVRHHHARV